MIKKTILSLLFSVVLLVNSANGYAQNADIELLQRINLNRNVQLDNSFKWISTSIYPVSVAVPLGLGLVGCAQQDSALLNKAIYIGASIAANFGLTYVLKYSVKRSRPYLTYPHLQHVVSEKSYSFPSGHSSDAFATATSLSIVFPKWYVIAPSYLWAAGVAYSRLHLGVHYPSDVLVGCLLGTGTAYVCHRLNKWLRK